MLLIKNEYLYTMIDEWIIELYRSNLAAVNEEKVCFMLRSRL